MEERAGASISLIHLLQGDATRPSDADANDTLLVDTKTYTECEQKPAQFFFAEEQHCSDVLQEYADTYRFDGLVPTTTYQFKVQVANAFGKSVPVITDPITGKQF